MKRSVFYTSLTALLFSLIGGWVYYTNYIDAKAVPDELEDPYVYFPTGSTFEDIVAILDEKGVIQNEASFRRLADYMKYKRASMRAGRFELKPGWTNIQLIRHLRTGSQAPVKVVLNNERMPKNVAKKVASFIEAEEQELLDLFSNKEFLRDIGYTKETLMSLFIPNTYEMYWNTNPEKFIDRMVAEHYAFWNKNNRLKKAKAISLSQAEVYTLASIVEKETLQEKEKPRIAGVYLNRLKQNIRLQADPTAVFATREFNVRRVLNRHIKFDSPYNTYRYAGLPPGPIAMSSISSIDAVLNAEKHEYIFFCAKGDGTGFHSFAKTLAGHNKNASRYRQNLRRRGLR